MGFIAVVSWDAEGRVTKFAPYKTLEEAQSHAAKYGGFAAADPGGGWGNWMVDVQQKTLIVNPKAPPVETPIISAQKVFDALKAKGILTDNDVKSAVAIGQV